MGYHDNRRVLASIDVTVGNHDQHISEHPKQGFVFKPKCILNKDFSVPLSQHLTPKWRFVKQNMENVLWVPDVYMSNGSTRPFLHSSIVCFRITLAHSKEHKYHIFRQYWYTRYVFTDDLDFQYLRPEVYLFQIYLQIWQYLEKITLFLESGRFLLNAILFQFKKHTHKKKPFSLILWSPFLTVV